MLNNKKTSSRASLIAVLMLIVSLAGTALGQQRASTASAASSSNRASQQNVNNDATTVFRSARDLITDGNWAKAQEKFDEYVTSYPNEKNIEAALYWLAYSQHKLAKYEQCRATVDRLLAKYPSTTWRDDARVLLAQAPVASALAAEELAVALEAVAATPLPPLQEPVIYMPAQGPQGIPGVPVAPDNISVAELTPMPAQIAGVIGFTTDEGSSNSDDDPCEFKIVVLQALFQTDLQRGIMAATEWLKPGSTQTARCKSAALTLLGRNGGKAVTPVILGVARNEPDLKLRARAISTLGATNDDTVIDALRDFALNSTDNDIVEASLYALSKHTGERAINVLSDIAISGKTTAQRKLAISSIASRPGEPAVDALFRIYDADQTIEVRKAVIYGFGNRKSERAGNRLLEIARTSDNVELRKSAVSSITRRGGDKVVESLLNLYNTEKNEEVKDQILHSFGSSHMYYTTKSPKGIVTAGQGVARTDDSRVTDKLIEIAKNPQEPMERRKRAIGWLSRSKDPKVLDFLQQLLQQ